MMIVSFLNHICGVRDRLVYRVRDTFVFMCEFRFRAVL